MHAGSTRLSRGLYPLASLIALCAGLCFGQNVAPTAGLVAYWPFDETSGALAHDVSGNNNNGTLVCKNNCLPLPNWTPGERNGGLNFTGPNDFVSVPDSAALRFTNGFTISFWLRKSTGTVSLNYVGKTSAARTNGFVIATGNPGNYVYINLFANGAQSGRCSTGAVLQDQTWQHFAITNNGSAMAIYVNGALNVTCNGAASAGTDASPVMIGGTNPANPDGIIDEVRMYNRTLSVAEVAAVYNDPGVPFVGPVSVSAGPANTTLLASQTAQFTASVKNNANPAVTWAISPAVGSISSSGLYTAPSSVSSQQTITVTATSVADPTKSGSITTTLSTAQVLATFQLPEFFGVYWPDQPIEFRYDGGPPPPGRSIMIGPAGSEVPFQWVTSCSDASAVKGCIVVRSGVSPNSSNTWTLLSGVTPSATPLNPVQITQAGSNLEIRNGLTGVRMITASGNPSPWNRAPIQGILLPGGTWTGAGSAPNFLYSEANQVTAPGCVGCSLQTPMYTATGFSVNITDSGPMKVVVKATYTFNRPAYTYGPALLNPPGTGHYTIIVTMYANSKSILVDEDSDMQFSYYLPLYSQLLPDLSRFRGHDAVDKISNSNPVCGYESASPITGATNGSPIVVSSSASLASGQAVLISGVGGNAAANGTYYAKTTGYASGQFGLYLDPGLSQPVRGSGGYSGGGVVKPAYRGQNISPEADAYLDLTYSGDRPASYTCSPLFYRKLMTNYPSASHAAGWYTELYQSAGGANAPVVGIYTGRASQQVNAATGPSMPGIYTSNNHWISGTQDAGIQVDNLLRGPDGSLSLQVHRNWGIWVSTQADLLPTTYHQPIADDQNSLTGINLSRLYTYQLVYPDPPGGWKWQYLQNSSANQLISQVRNGTSVCGSVNCYYNLLKNSEGSIPGTSLLNMWQGNSTAAVQTALNTGIQLAQRIGQTLATGDNHFDTQFAYYQLGLQTSPETAVMNAVIMDSNSTAQQKASAKAALAFFGCLFWDDDWFPIDNVTGESYGLANQIQQYMQYRTQSAAADPSQPFLASALPMAATYPANDFAAYFSPTGAVAGSTHYQSAFFEPLILNYLTLAQDGTLSFNDPKWAAYANWELSIQTPPEPRFGNLRKGYTNGDGNTEADVRPGMLGTAMYSANPALASNLMWAWQQSNSATILTEDSQFVTTVAAIDPTIPAVAPQLSSINVPGYHSSERHGFGTPNETALWFINGGFYSDGGHRHADDGQVSIYAHSAPLAIDWNANLYNPQTPGRFMHNSVVFDSELPHVWSDDNASLSDANTLMQNPGNTEFAAFRNSTTSTGTFTSLDGTLWTRTVRTMAFNLSYPIIYVSDSFAGPSAGTGKTLTWNLMATGPVSTPSGPVTPTTRFSAGCQSPAGALPSSGNVIGLSGGLQQFNFTGANWPQHATKGINWDLYTISSGTQQFSIGNWGHGCHSSRETAEYLTANGAPFAEVQDILRIHDTGTFMTMILPYRKTETPARAVTQQGCGVQIIQGPESTCFNNSVAIYSKGTTGIMTVYDSSSQSAFGVAVAGGPQEVVIQPGQIVWTVAGVEAGTRTLTIPGNWTATPAAARSGNTFSYSYAGGAQATPVTITFSSGQ